MEAAGGGRGEPAVEAVVEAGEARAPLARSDDKLSDTNHASQVEKKFTGLFWKIFLDIALAICDN